MEDQTEKHEQMMDRQNRMIGCGSVDYVSEGVCGAFVFNFFLLNTSMRLRAVSRKC